MSELLRSPDAELAALEARIARLERLEEQVIFRSGRVSALNEAMNASAEAVGRSSGAHGSR